MPTFTEIIGNIQQFSESLEMFKNGFFKNLIELINFWIFENFLNIFGNRRKSRKSSKIIGSVLKLFLSNFASFANFL